MRHLLTVILILSPAPLSAGAWPREAGRVFLSVSYEYTTWNDAYTEERLTETEGEIETFGYTAIYGEVGLTDRLTFGVDLGQENLPDTRTNIAFLRAAIGPLDWRNRFAVEIGVGERQIPTYGLDRGSTEGILRPGLAWGYGFATPVGPAWTGLDLKAELRQQTGEDAYKADLTFGLNPEGPWLAYLQLQNSDYPGAGPALRIAPTLVREITPWLAVEGALLYDVYGAERAGVKAGLWLQF